MNLFIDVAKISLILIILSVFFGNISININHKFENGFMLRHEFSYHGDKLRIEHLKSPYGVTLKHSSDSSGVIITK